MCSDIASSYWQPHQGYKDAEKYFEYGKKACTGNATFTCFHVAYAYSVAIGTKANGEKAYEYFKNICEATAQTEREKKTKRNACGQVEVVAERLGKDPKAQDSDSGGNKRTVPDLSKATGVVNFFLYNSCNSSSPMKLIFRESYRGELTGFSWPSAGHYLFTEKRVTRTKSVKCAYPSDVCYGAAIDFGGGKSTSWGLGLTADGSCTNCCYACPSRSRGYGYRDVKLDFVCN